MKKELEQFKKNVDERVDVINMSSTQEVGSAIAKLAEEIGYRVGRRKLTAEEASQAVAYLYTRFGLVSQNPIEKKDGGN